MTGKNTFAAIVLVTIALVGWFVARKRDDVLSRDHGVVEDVRHSSQTATGGDTRFRSGVRNPNSGRESREKRFEKAQELLRGVIEASGDRGVKGLGEIRQIIDLIKGLDGDELRSLTEQLIDSNNRSLIGMLSQPVMKRFAQSKIETGEICLWLKQLQPSLGRSMMLQELGVSYTDARGTAITDLLDEFPDQRDKLEVLTGLVGRLASSSVENAISVYEEHAPEGSDPGRLGEILSGLPHGTDFPAVIERLLQSDPAKLGPIVGGMIARWAEYEPEAACNYAYGKSAVADDQVREAFLVWAQSDPRSAKRWLEGLAASGKKDFMVSEFVRSRARMAPAASWKQSYQISDPELREKTISEIYEKWRAFSPEDADQALQTHKAGLENEH